MLQGNLLRRGPVVFRIPPEVVRSVRKDADGGDAACEQLMLDLYRCSDDKLSRTDEAAAGALAQLMNAVISDAFCKKPMPVPALNR
jgi:hypothetical protein